MRGAKTRRRAPLIKPGEQGSGESGLNGDLMWFHGKESGCDTLLPCPIKAGVNKSYISNYPYRQAFFGRGYGGTASKESVNSLVKKVLTSAGYINYLFLLGR